MRAFSRSRGTRQEKGSRRSPESKISSEEGKVDPDLKEQKSQRLKPDKWRAAFDAEGKLVGFSKLLKSIISGGVDNSIRCEVWEFLLGCYGLGTTREYRQEIRRERRKRYRELIEQCRLMHVSIGTGSLAFNVGSKIMDARVTSRQTTELTKIRSTTSEAPDVEGVAGASTSSSSMDQSPVTFGFASPTNPENDTSFCSDFSCSETPEQESRSNHKNSFKSMLLQHRKELVEKDEMRYSPGRIGPNSPNILHFKFFQQSSSTTTTTTTATTEAGKSSSRIWTNSARDENFGRVKALESAPREVRSRAPPAGMPSPNPNPTPHRVQAGVGNDERTAEWLWTLHKIVVDVVRTDRHLKFYDDSRNMARMSDILAVYAWIDPETGYCQGMSDLLSPFVVLFQDDADAFWCFESLLRRMRQNFQMAGPTGVMRQLEALPKIMELIDARVFRHLVVIGADSFLFAFRMLLLHFRRELSFGEALCMWEMMWAADFEHSMLWVFENEPLESLQIRPPSRSLQERLREDDCLDYYCSRISPYASPLGASDDSFSEQCVSEELKSPLCGLNPGYLFNRQKLQRYGLSFGRNGDSEISVFVVAAILVSNRGKFLKEARSMEDVIKMFNEIELKIRVRRCVREALKLRTSYHQQVTKAIA